MLLVGKTLGGEIYTVSCMLSNIEIMDVFRPDDYDSTFVGNPIGATVYLAALNLFKQDKLAERFEQLKNYFIDELRKLNSPCVKEVRDKGLLLAVEINKEYGSAKIYCEKLMELGLLCKETHNQTIRFADPLIITNDEIVRKVLCE